LKRVSKFSVFPFLEEPFAKQDRLFMHLGLFLISNLTFGLTKTHAFCKHLQSKENLSNISCAANTCEHRKKSFERLQTIHSYDFALRYRRTNLPSQLTPSPLFCDKS